MRGSRGLRGRKNILILLVAAALVVGLFPVGAFAFAPDETDDAPELATVEDTADLETGTAPESTTADEAAAEMAEDPDTADGQLLAQAFEQDGLGVPTITVAAPTAGTTSATAPVVTGESGAGYSVSNTKWCDADGRPLTDPVTFEAGQTYHLSTQLTPTTTSGTKSYFATNKVTCNGGDVELMFNGWGTRDGRTVIASLGPVISVTATGAAEEVRIRWGSDSNNGDVRYSYTANNGSQINGTQAGSGVFTCKTGSTLTLTAVPKENYGFVGWFSANYDTSGVAFAPSGDALSTDPTYTITVDSSMEQTGYCAVFAPKFVVCGLYISLDGPNGSATIEYIDHRTGLPNSFTLHGHSLQAVRVVYGTDVTVTAVPDEGYSLVGWFEDPDDKNTLVSTDTTYTYTATEPTILMAEFEHNHTWGAWTATANPTCTAPGAETRACTGCDKKETREVAALGHDWGEGKVTTEPTCAQTGVRTFTCTRCGNTKTEAIPTLEHTWGAWEVVKEATETEDGEEARSCSRCGEKETRAISHLGVQYRSTEGDGATWSKGSGETLAFTFKRNVSDDVTFAHFIGIKVDDVEVDASNYSAAAGSVVVTLNASYLEGLSAGDHTITALFNDGDSASATFTVAAASDKPAEDKPADGKPAEDKPAEDKPADAKPSDKPASDTPSGDKGSNAAKPANAAPASGTAARKTLPATDDPTRAWSGLLAAVALCGAAAFVAGSRMRPARSRRKHTRS